MLVSAAFDRGVVCLVTAPPASGQIAICVVIVVNVMPLKPFIDWFATCVARLTAERSVVEVFTENDLH